MFEIDLDQSDDGKENVVENGKRVNPKRAKSPVDDDELPSPPPKIPKTIRGVRKDDNLFLCAWANRETCNDTTAIQKRHGCNGLGNGPCEKTFHAWCGFQENLKEGSARLCKEHYMERLVGLYVKENNDRLPRSNNPFDPSLERADLNRPEKAMRTRLKQYYPSETVALENN